MADWVREDLMRLAIELSNGGFPAPNPHVGCVIERGGVVVGEGFHEYAGGPHAEVVALRQAGEKADGATAYVTLEPCNHFGRTPPCSEALVEAGIARVAIACADPNSKAAGGADRLREAGIEVAEGVLAEEAAASNTQFLHAMARKRPYVVAKAAMTLDGRIALPSGESKWITGEEARRQAHVLRARSGAVLVGVGTVRSDDPRLTARVEGVYNQPLRVVLDPQGILTQKEAIFREPGEVLWLVGSAKCPEQFELPLDNGLFDPAAVLRVLWERGQTGVLIEGGAQTLRSFIFAEQVDRLELFVAPRVLGAGPAWLEGGHLAALSDSLRFRFLAHRLIGEDLWISAEPVRSGGQ